MATKKISLLEKLVVLNYARYNGPSAASKKFHYARTAIDRWNAELNIYPTGTSHRQFTTEQKIALLQEVCERGLIDTAKRHNIRASTLTRWNQELNIYQPEFTRVFSDNFKRQAVFLANMHGIEVTARAYKIPVCTLNKWMPIFCLYRPHTTPSYEKRVEILTFAREHGFACAAKKYNRHLNTLHNWNSVLHIIPKKSPSNKAAYLRLARRVLHKLPLGQRSTANAFKIVGKKYNFAPSTLYDWNLEYKLIPVFNNGNKIQLVTPDDIKIITETLRKNRGRKYKTMQELRINKDFFNQIINHYKIPVR